MGAAQKEIPERVRHAVTTHSASMLRLAFSYVRSTQDAEDMVQDVFLNYLKAAPAFTSAEHEKAWLLRATINRCKNLLGSGWWGNRRPLPESLGYMMPERSELLCEVLALEEKYRLPIHLHYYEGYPIKEIAQILGEKPATIGTRLARGRELLKGRIGGIENG